MLIYVAGPYTNDDPEKVLANVERAIDIGIELIEKGHTPYIPHLSHYVEMRVRANYHGEGFEREFWINYTQKWLAKCDAILHYAGSNGADKELGFAIAHRMTVFFSVEDVPDIGPEPPG